MDHKSSASIFFLPILNESGSGLQGVALGIVREEMHKETKTETQGQTDIVTFEFLDLVASKISQFLFHVFYNLQAKDYLIHLLQYS